MSTQRYILFGVFGVVALLCLFGVFLQLQSALEPQEITELKLQNQTAKLTYQTERLRMSQKVNESKEVQWASKVLAVFWRLSPIVALFAGFVYFVFKPMPFELGDLKAQVSRWNERPVLQSAMLVSAMSEQTKALAFQESVANARADTLVKFAHAIRPGRESVAALKSVESLPDELPQRVFPVPTFASLLNSGDIGAGLPLLMGFTADNQPQRRTIKDIKALSVAGEQGSGKTASMAYLITSTVLIADDAEAWIVDPHWKHPEGLGAMIEPLTHTGRVHLINPMEIESTIDALNARLDRRLAGLESSAAPIIFGVDELAKMGKSPMFTEKLLPFVERFTEETRKAGMIGVFGSQKWNARHFGNKADIRGTIPSLLIHKIKPSQANLLLEDNDNKRLMKQVSLPGQALMATSHDADPSVITVPLITRFDIENVAKMMTASANTNQQSLPFTLNPFDAALQELKSRMSLEEMYRKSGLCNGMTLATFETKCKPSSKRAFTPSEEAAILNIKED